MTVAELKAAKARADYKRAGGVVTQCQPASVLNPIALSFRAGRYASQHSGLVRQASKRFAPSTGAVLTPHTFRVAAPDMPAEHRQALADVRALNITE